MRALRAVFLLNGAALGVFYPFVAVMLAGRGASPAEIGLVMAASSAAFSIALPAWGHVADVMLGRRRTLVVTALGAAVFVLLAGAPAALAVVTLGFVGFSFFESAWGPLGDALAVNAVRGGGGAYGRIRLLASIGFGAVAAAAGFLYDRTGYGPASILCAVLAVLLAVAALGTPDVERADLAAVGGERGRGGSFGAALRLEPRLRPVLLAVLLLFIGMAAGFTYLPLRVVELGGGPSEVALLGSVSAFAEIPGMLLAGVVASRIGIRGLVAASALVYGACFVSWVVLASPTLVVASRFVAGFAFAGQTVGAVMTMAALLPPRLQGTGQGLYQLTGFGVAAVIANVGGGLIYGAFGAGPVFAAAFVLAVAAALVAWTAFPASGGAAPAEEDLERSLPFPGTPA